MFVGTYSKVEHLKGSSLGYYRALLENIRLGWKGLPGTNTLAYHKSLYNMDVKRTLYPGRLRTYPTATELLVCSSLAVTFTLIFSSKARSLPEWSTHGTPL